MDCDDADDDGRAGSTCVRHPGTEDDKQLIGRRQGGEQAKDDDHTATPQAYGLQFGDFCNHDAKFNAFVG